jgi:hypothetical protein
VPRSKEIYETPETENKTIQWMFSKNNKSIIRKTTGNVSTSIDYEYSIEIEAFEYDGFNSTFFLTSTNSGTKEKRVAIFQFQGKNTLVFYNRSPSARTYYSRK